MNPQRNNMSDIAQSREFSRLLRKSINMSDRLRHEFVMPEHLLLALTTEPYFVEAFNEFSDISQLQDALKKYLDSCEKIPADIELVLEFSSQMSQLLTLSAQRAVSAGRNTLFPDHVIATLLEMKGVYASELLHDALKGNESEFLVEIISQNEDFKPSESPGDTDYMANEEMAEYGGPSWKKYVTEMNPLYKERNPLIGREAELERTIQTLCRRDKNNPLHVGEPGVGKTALVWGLVRKIEEGDVPERLRGSRVFQIDMSTIVAGTQFRGDMEKRLKEIMEGIMAEGDNNIVYIDEIHTIVGTGASSDHALDASNILKPYLESGRIRFIGSTTYEEFNRYISKSKGLMRRFQQIDIEEPTTDEAKEIVRQLRPHYEKFHGVRYSEKALDYAVESSARHINDRYLPDKAIDLIDEAGAAMEMKTSRKTIGVKEIADVLAKTCKVDSLSQTGKDDISRLAKLDKTLHAKIFGQDAALQQVVESVQMSWAGLLETNKPLASLLFVGPTGVGKTEVARVLAQDLGVELVRFDMSEYAEKHSVAKLIGSPAGYVGYEDGGQLTDAIRKAPNSVLLLDEIEKAHPDIYNILLQVMDYGMLTDNKGRKTDFRNVILIMTSNAGAQYASRSAVGFESNVSRGNAMLQQVKKTFKPEFLNRLTDTVVFNDMDKAMATLILKKKLKELETALKAKGVKLQMSKEVLEQLMKEGFTPEYGAREMDRVIRHRLKPLLTKEILFGSLKKGGTAKFILKDGSISIK